MSTFFEYGEREMELLKLRDPILGAAIDRIGKIQREVIPDPFTALISSIVSQQISKKAAETVWNRFSDLLGNVSPMAIMETELEKIQACGMSMREAQYIKGIASAAISGDVNFESFSTMTDQEIILKLTSLNGVGVWTAEMLLIFSLNRPDVLSFNDLAIRRGMMRLYGISELSRSKFEDYRKLYSPYGSVASLYLWELSVQD